jgi:hypothetical protein
MPDMDDGVGYRPVAAVAADGTGMDGSAPATNGADGAAEKKKKRKAKKKKKADGGWTQAKVNTWVYVQGLPHDATEDELAVYFRKAGILKSDLETKRPKIKLYKTPEGVCKVRAVRGRRWCSCCCCCLYVTRAVPE